MASACPRPVAISGLGLATALGAELAGTWEKLSHGVSGTAHLEGFSYRGKPLPVGRCPTAALTDSLGRAGRVLDEEQPRALTLAECVAAQALSATSAKNPERIGLYLGSSLTTSDYVARGYERYFAGKRASPSALVDGMNSSLASGIAARFGIAGPVCTVSSSCASSLQSAEPGGFALEGLRRDRSSCRRRPPPPRRAGRTKRRAPPRPSAPPPPPPRLAPARAA